MACSKIYNKLQDIEECPHCHHTFITGYHENNDRKCTNCKNRFKSGEKVNHGSGCSICHSRYNGTNNIHFNNGCPALMSDGRFITYYNSANELTDAMRKMNGIVSTNEFRTFMQNNGDKLIAAERDYLNKKNTCQPQFTCSQGWNDLRQNIGDGYQKNQSKF